MTVVGYLADCGGAGERLLYELLSLPGGVGSGWAVPSRQPRTAAAGGRPCPWRDPRNPLLLPCRAGLPLDWERACAEAALDQATADTILEGERGLPAGANEAGVVDDARVGARGAGPGGGRLCCHSQQWRMVGTRPVHGRYAAGMRPVRGWYPRDTTLTLCPHRPSSPPAAIMAHGAGGLGPVKRALPGGEPAEGGAVAPWACSWLSARAVQLRWPSCWVARHPCSA